MAARHVGNADKVVGQVLQYQSVQRSEDQHRQLESYALRRAQPVKAGERLSDVVGAPKTGDACSASACQQMRNCGWPIANKRLVNILQLFDIS